MIWISKADAKRATHGGIPKPRGPMATRNQPEAKLRTLSWLPFAVGIAGVALIAGALYAAWLYTPELPVREVVVTGDITHTTRDELARASEAAAGNLLALDLQQVRAEMKRLPWVREALVSRALPARVEIYIEEHQPAARWRDSDGRALVNSHGEVFRADFPGPLPMLEGPLGAAPEVSRQQQRFAQILGEAPQEVHLSARGAWQVKLSDGTVLELGRNDAEARLARFVVVRSLAPQLQGGGLKVDLRYANGMALTKTAAMLEIEKELATRKKKA